RRRGINRPVLTDGERRHFLFGKSREGVHFARWGDPQYLAGVSGGEKDGAVGQTGGGENRGLRNSVDMLGVSRQAQQTLGCHRDAWGLAARKISGRVADPDLGRRSRRGRANRRRPENDETEEALFSRGLHQMRGETSIVSRTDPLTGIGSSIDSDCSLK